MKSKKLWILILIIINLSLVFSSCSSTKTEADFSRINSVCELATLKCYYHNVAKSESPATGILKVFGVGYKKLWIEYSGVVKLGLDANKISISKPNKKGIITVTIPDAEILDVDLDENSIGPPLKDQGFMTSITKEEETATLANSQKDMEESAQANTDLLKQAKNRAKQVLEAYIINVGKEIGQDYIIEWEDYK